MENKLPKRKPNRIKDFDYSQNGIYFITICTRNKKCILWDKEKGLVPGDDGCLTRDGIVLSDVGKTADEAINKIAEIYKYYKVENYAVMPNHIHLLISKDDGRLLTAPTDSASVSVMRIIKELKSYVSRKCGKGIWQKSFYDHIIRDKNDYKNAWLYIENNPANWLEDELFER